jgi:hypothetical protein
MKIRTEAIIAYVLLLAGIVGVPDVPAHAQNKTAVKLTQKEFEDGTGSIGVAPGWRYESAYRGTVQCLGPNNAAVVLGFPWTVTRPDSEVAQFVGPDQPMAAVGDIPNALREVLAKKVRATLKSLRSQSAPPAIDGVPAYYMLYEYVQDGKTFVALGYLTTLNYGPSSPSWTLYASAVVAPKDQFMKQLPTMLAMWKSWRPNGSNPRAGSESAKFDKMLNDRIESFEKMQAEFRKLL